MQSGPAAADRVGMNALAQVRALHVLAAAKLGRPAHIEPASSVTNEVWLTPEHVVRINRRATGRLRREATLAPVLPPASGYPGIIAAGDGGGMDWLILRRKPGVPLARAWPSMDTAARRSAVRQLATRLRQIHATATPDGLPPLETPQLLDAGALFPLAPLQRALVEARHVPNVPGSLVDDLTARVGELAPAIGAFGASTLIHGDLTFENVLWDGTRVSAIIDFEWSRGAPRDLDLDVFLRMCAYPFLHVAADYEQLTHERDYADVPSWLADDYPELFDVPRLAERLELYSLAFDLHELLQFPPVGAAPQLPKLHALNRLGATLGGRGHLTRWYAASLR